MIHVDQDGKPNGRGSYYAGVPDVGLAEADLLHEREFNEEYHISDVEVCWEATANPTPGPHIHFTVDRIVTAAE